MSQTTVLNAAETTAATVAAVTVTRQGWPQAVPWTGTLGVVVYLDPAPIRRRQITGGPAGIVEHRYGVYLRAILGAADADAGAMLAAATALDDAMRQAFYADRTLGGVCVASELCQAQDNLPVYRRDQVEPCVLWRLDVTEHRAANASAAP